MNRASRNPRRGLRRGLLAVLGLVAAFAASVLLPVTGSAGLRPARLPADNHTSARLVWQRASLYGQPVPYWPWTVKARVVAGAERLRLVGPDAAEPGAARFELGILAVGPPGPATVELDTGLGRQRFELEVVPAELDRDSDGLPDLAELVDERDRTAFRDWFTAIAQAQFYAPDPRWEQVQRDCAGLARFAYKEALRRHDRDWLARTPYLHQVPGADVRRFQYPEVPLLGDRLFRVRAGAFGPGDDPARDFSPAANARTLWEHNTLLVSRRADQALAGDLLFFGDRLGDPGSLHTMILLDPPGSGAQRRVVYHTGASGAEPGEVRLVRLADLDAHSDGRWHVRDDNPDFYGFYRWKMLEGGPR